MQPTEARPSPRQRLERAVLTRRRLTRARLDAFVAPYSTELPALVVHSHDIDHRRHFPRAFFVTHDAKRRPDVVADRHYVETLATLPSASRRLIVCTGLLEHLPEPGRAVEEFARILEPGGTLLLSASAVFSYHGAPDNFFHFAPGGFRRMLEGRLELVDLAGSTGPFETLGVLAQRISLQCDVWPPARLVLELLTNGLPLLDRFVRRQYDNLARIEPADDRIGIMPATLLAVARKPEGTA